MFSLLHGGSRLAQVALLVAPAAIGVSSSLAVAGVGRQPDAGVYGTPLAVTGMPVAQEATAMYDNWLLGAYWAASHPHRAGQSALHAWIWEQRVAWRTGGHGGLGYGTLGWGGPGQAVGFYGFGLSFHRGYGYGGYGLGVGADGGVPFYGGPGYPCLGHPYDGGPAFTGLPSPLIRPEDRYERPGLPSVANGGVGADNRARAEAVVGPGQPDFGYNSGEGTGVGYRGSFGPFTGASSYAYTHPGFTAEAAAAGTVFDAFGDAGSVEWQPAGRGRLPAPDSTGPNAPPGLGPDSRAPGSSPGTGALIPLPAPVPALGIDEEPVVDDDGVRGTKVARVHVGTPAEKAGLKAGDVIHSVNGRLTQQAGNLTWIIANSAPDRVLKMSVRRGIDGKEHTITVQLSLEPPSSARPTYLPPVNNGPPPAAR
jgi:hypothetical protein